jgi:hypothetical protein
MSPTSCHCSTPHRLSPEARLDPGPEPKDYSTPVSLRQAKPHPDRSALLLEKPNHAWLIINSAGGGIYEGVMPKCKTPIKNEPLPAHNRRLNSRQADNSAGA